MFTIKLASYFKMFQSYGQGWQIERVNDGGIWPTNQTEDIDKWSTNQVCKLSILLPIIEIYDNFKVAKNSLIHICKEPKMIMWVELFKFLKI